MIPNNIKIIQLFNIDDDPVGLYITQREDVEKFQSYFDAAFSNLDIDNIQDNADDWLSTHKQIYRYWAEKVITNSI